LSRFYITYFEKLGVNVWLERKKEVLDTYHKAVRSTNKDVTAGEPTKKPKKKSNDIGL
jgi:hypothetical protein